MARLANSPMELIILIGSMISLQDIESIALTSHRLSEGSVKRLGEHRALKRNHTYHDCASTRYSLSGLLEEVLTDPRIAKYIKRLRIGGNPAFPRNLIVPTQKSANKFQQAASKHAPEGMAWYWRPLITQGREAPVIALLVLLLPNLTTLDIRRMGDREYIFSSTISRITHMQGTERPLSKLSSVIFRKSSVDVENHFYLVQQLVRLPSLRSITLFGMDWKYMILEPVESLPPRSSNLVEMNFNNCAIRLERIHELVKACIALRGYSLSKMNS